MTFYSLGRCVLVKHNFLFSANVNIAKNHLQPQGVFKPIKAEIPQKTMDVIAFRNCVKELQLRESRRSERTIDNRKNCKTIMLLYLSGLIRRDHLLLLRKSAAYSIYIRASLMMVPCHLRKLVIKQQKD